MTIQVSIIMPVYNGARFIAQSIESVLVQTLSSWELLIVDDGSTDGTPEILKDYEDSRIRVIHQSNQGASVARNEGLARAQGQYVAFLDADDLYLPETMAEYVAYLEAHPEYDVVYADGWVCDERNQPLIRIGEHRSGVYEGSVLEKIVVAADVIGFPVCTLTRHATIREHQVRFDSALSIVEDWDFWIYLARWARFGYLDKLLCLYRVHPHNATHSQVDLCAEMIVRNRFKVMNEPWFDSLTLTTRYDFLQGFLNGHLADDIDRQQTVLASSAFRLLPHPEQARLLRAVSTAHMMRNTEDEFVGDCLKRALVMHPDGSHTRFLLWLWQVNPYLCRKAVLLWHTLRRAFGAMKKHPIPLP